MPDYTDNDPKGWGGDPARGAAMGRSSKKGIPEGAITFWRVLLSEGYDRNGTYFGEGDPLFWVTDESGSLDFCQRGRLGAKSIRFALRTKYPTFEILEGGDLGIPCEVEGCEVDSAPRELPLRGSRGYLPPS